MRRFEYRLACAVVVSAALTGSTVPAQAVADGDAVKPSATDGANALSTFPEFAAIPDSATLDLPQVLHGAVEQITGATMPGSQVLLSAWPSNSSVLKMPVGAEFDVIPMARAVADDAGNYVLRAGVTDLLRSLAGSDGIDVELNVFHGDRHYTYLSQVTPTADGSWVRQLTGLAGPVAPVVDAATNLLNLTLDRTKAAVEGGLGITGDGPVTAAHRKPVPPGCTPYEKVGDELVWQTVATSLTNPNVTAEVAYRQGARTESSTGSSYQGGVFSANGSRSRTTTVGGIFDDEEVKRRGIRYAEYQVQVLHIFLRRSCARDFQGNEDVVVWTSPGEITKATRINPSPAKAWRCTSKDRRTIPTGLKDYVVDKEQAAVYERGFELTPLPGVKFGGRSLSGYNSAVSVVMHFRLPRSSPFKLKWVCGDTAKPDAPGQRIQGFFE